MSASAAQSAAKRLVALVPGLLLTIGLAALGIGLAESGWLRRVAHISPLLLVILLGMALKTVWRPHALAQPGVVLAQKPILRWGVAGLGLKLSLGELAAYGWGPLVVVVATTLAAIWLGCWVGRALGLPRKFALLLSVGGGICGASAIVAADSVVQGEKSDSAYSLGVITLLGTIGIVLYPLAYPLLGLTDFTYGVWTGASLHEMAQVVAAAAAVSEEAKVTGSAVKLARICLLAPVVFYIGWRMRAAHQAAGAARVSLVPWFLLCFLAFAVLNSLHAIPVAWYDVLQRVGLWLLCIGMAGVGLQAGFGDLRRAGAAPLAAGAAQWVFLALTSFLLVRWLCPA